MPGGQGRTHHRHCQQHEAAEQASADDASPKDTPSGPHCQCALIQQVAQDEREHAKLAIEAAFTRGVAHGLADAVGTLAGMASRAELNGLREQASALRDATARLWPDALPVDPQIAVTFEARALEPATVMLRHDLASGHWEAHPDVEQYVTAILDAWQAPGQRNAARKTAVMALSLWEEAAALLRAAPQVAPAALAQIQSMLAAFEPEPSRAEATQPQIPRCE